MPPSNSVILSPRLFNAAKSNCAMKIMGRRLQNKMVEQQFARCYEWFYNTDSVLGSVSVKLNQLLHLHIRQMGEACCWRQTTRNFPPVSRSAIVSCNLELHEENAKICFLFIYIIFFVLK